MSEHRKTYEGKVYFVTLTVVGWIDVFTRYEYVQELINNLKYCQKNKGLKIYTYVIMSNHMHMIASVENGTLGAFLRDFKSYTSKKIIELIKNSTIESRKDWMLELFERFGSLNPDNKTYQFWQNTNHPIELWNSNVIDQKVEYIHNNPVKAGIVEKAEEYKYSSAYDFSEIKVDEM